MASAREPSMEDILASIKRVIAEEKEIRAAAPPPSRGGRRAAPTTTCSSSTKWSRPSSRPPIDLGPPLLTEEVAGASRSRLEELATVAAAAPPPAPAANPLEELVREMLRPILKQWLDDHLPQVVDEHVKREIHRITGRAASNASPRAILRIARPFASVRAMNKHIALAAVAASALVAATPSLARPMTATDMHMMHRLGAPERLARRAHAPCSLCRPPTSPRTSAATRSTCST